MCLWGTDSLDNSYFWVCSCNIFVFLVRMGLIITDVDKCSNKQGVRGAYSESAAEKAYPNCEAVPCEQFDTTFEVII